MFLHHDHQQEEITGADPLKTVTKGDMMCDPRLEGARPQNAASLEPLDRWRVAYDRGNTTRCPAILEKEARGVIKGVGSLWSKNVGDIQISTTRDQGVETQ
jgi:hypothetical protein